MNDFDRLFYSVTTGYAVARLSFAFADYALVKVQAFAERINPMRKTYGPEQVRVIPEVEFSLNVEHENPETGQRELRTHDFVGKPDPSSGDFARFTLATGVSDNGAEVVRVLMEILPRMIDNSDGVSATWEFRELEPEDQAGETRFYGPDGQLHPVSERSKYDAFEAGSSRRRLYNLMFVDPNARVQMPTVVEIMKDLFEAAADRPTSA